MDKAAVIGDPIEHSLSPAIFRIISRVLKKHFQYEAVKVSPDDLFSFMENASGCFKGLNVTIPHKEKILSLLDDVSAEAKAVGAVNVVEFKKGKALGYNTDVQGTRETWTKPGINLNRVLIIGAGGAARAVAYAAGLDRAQEVVIVNRTLSRAKKTAEDFGQIFKTRFEVMDELRPDKPFSLIVNTTPCGTEGAPLGTYPQNILSRAETEPGSVAFDLIYRPFLTPFLDEAKKRKMRCINGLEMLVCQAVATWEIWFGQVKEKVALHSELVKQLTRILSNQERPIFITGFMGVGKSTVGRLLAQKVGRKFVDTDQEIQSMSGCSIKEILETKGEAEFRALEAQVIKSVCRKKNVVVALGGGALINSDNLSEVKGAGDLIYLSATIDELVKRLENQRDARPLLKEEDLKSRIEQLLKSRSPGYAQAEIEIATNGLQPHEVAEKIAENYEAVKS